MKYIILLLMAFSFQSFGTKQVIEAKSAMPLDPYTKAKRILSQYKTAAMKGDVKAQFNLGWMYRKGEGVAKNPKLSFYWYKKAAMQGHVQAQRMLGFMYFDGESVVKNKKPALYEKLSFYWYKKAAIQGNADAQYMLGLMYGAGVGVAKNKKRSSYWYKKANY